MVIGFCRANRGISRLGDLFVSQLVVVAQAEYDPLLGRKRQQGVLQPDRLQVAVIYVGVGSRACGSGVRRQREPFFAVAAQNAQCLAGRDPVDPCGERAACIEPSESTEYPYEGLLRSVLGIRMDRDEPADVPIDRLLVSRHQQSKAPVGMCFHRKDDLLVFSGHGATRIFIAGYRSSSFAP